MLRCAGLDTVARVALNGQPVGSGDNMFRTYVFDAKPALRPGSNRITVTFEPIQPYIDAFIKNAPKGENTTSLGIANIRKSVYSDGWDFCPRFLTCGLYKSIELIAYDGARLTGTGIDTQVEPGRPATVILRPVIEYAADSHDWSAPAMMRTRPAPPRAARPRSVQPRRRGPAAYRRAAPRLRHRDRHRA